jgi:hypothetical protein
MQINMTSLWFALSETMSLWFNLVDVLLLQKCRICRGNFPADVALEGMMSQE